MRLVIVKHALGGANLYRKIGKAFFEDTMAAVERHVDRDSARTEQAEYAKADE